MDYVKPNEVLNSMVEAGKSKAELPIMQLLVRGSLGGAILACATTLAITAAAQTKIPMVGALLFPVGFVMIILLGLELVTGSFGLIPLAVLEKKTTVRRMLNNFLWVIIGHLLGCAVYAVLYALTITKMGTDMSNPIIQVLTFFGQGFEHTVVNMFVIPAGMLLGANVSFADWWMWNGIPVLVGNFIGGVLFTGVLFYLSQRSFKTGRPSAAVIKLPRFRMEKSS